MSDEKRWRVITVNTPFGEQSYISRHRISDERMEEIWSKYRCYGVDLMRDFGFSEDWNIILSVYSINDKSRAENVLDKINDGANLLTLMEGEE